MTSDERAVRDYPGFEGKRADNTKGVRVFRYWGCSGWIRAAREVS